MVEYIVALWLGAHVAECGDPCRNVPPHGKVATFSTYGDACVATESDEGGFSMALIKHGKLVVLMGPGVHQCEVPQS